MIQYSELCGLTLKTRTLHIAPVNAGGGWCHAVRSLGAAHAAMRTGGMTRRGNLNRASKRVSVLLMRLTHGVRHLETHDGTMAWRTCTPCGPGTPRGTSRWVNEPVAGDE